MVSSRIPQITIGADYYENSVIVSRNIDGFAESIKSFTVPLTAALHEVIIPAIKQNFAEEGRPKWQSLSAATIRIRGTAHPILINSGRLYEYATSSSIWIVGRNSLRVKELPVAYAKFHQTGTRHMPARPFMTLTDKDKEKIVAIFSAWVEAQARRRGKFKKK